MASFETNPISLEYLLKSCETGKIKLPEFQRSWVWDDDRLKGLIASISAAFPIGAVMTLKTGGDLQFEERTIQGAPDDATSAATESLLLDGQQRLTSLYQICMRQSVVETVTSRRKKVRRWYYFDINKALDDGCDREESIIGLPEDRVLRRNFGREEELNLSTREAEYKHAMFPMNRIFDWDSWQDGFGDYWIGRGQEDKRYLFRAFKNKILQNFKSYQVPVIKLGSDTSREAVCLVFEKVNTGGKPLDAFELVTAMYAAQGFRLRKDWLGEGAQSGRRSRIATFGRIGNQDYGLLERIASTDFLQSISLKYTKKVRNMAEDDGREGRELPSVSANRQSLLNLPLCAYKKYADDLEEGFQATAKFLRLMRIYRIADLPYQTQCVPLAAILAEIGHRWENATVRNRLVQWYWNGVFGELYGSAIESRFARDIVEVPRWLQGHDIIPSTVGDSAFRADRLLTMRSRLSAAYKGVNALLMRRGARDFRSGQEFDQTVFFDESVDIHHIFPRDWCKSQKIPASIYDSIINKTPLSSRTNRILGGDAPSVYLERLEKGDKGAPISTTDIDAWLDTHLIDSQALRSNDFEGFFEARRLALLNMIQDATGQIPYAGDTRDEPEEDVPDEVIDEEGVLSIAP